MYPRLLGLFPQMRNAVSCTTQKIHTETTLNAAVKKTSAAGGVMGLGKGKKKMGKVAAMETDIACPEIVTGEVIVDRKSRFQGHAAVVHSLQDVKAVLSKLMQNKKVANATHNMYAYRIEVPAAAGSQASAVVVQDCSDDGEAHAGSRLLHLLQILAQSGTLVVVSRWYGGIQLGPDRFRHINNAARQVLTQAGLINK